MRGGVTCAQAGPDAAQIESRGVSSFADARQWLLEVQSNVVGERFERGDVKDCDLIAQLTTLRLAHQAVDGPHERRQRFATPGGRTQEHVMTAGALRLCNERPADFLGARRFAKT